MRPRRAARCARRARGAPARARRRAPPRARRARASTRRRTRSSSPRARRRPGAPAVRTPGTARSRAARSRTRRSRPAPPSRRVYGESRLRRVDTSRPPLAAGTAGQGNGYPCRARGVAQPGSALRSGRRGPQFKSGHPDFPQGGNPGGFPPRESRLRRARKASLGRGRRAGLRPRRDRQRSAAPGVGDRASRSTTVASTRSRESRASAASTRPAEAAGAARILVHVLQAVLLDVDFTLFRPGPELGPQGYARVGARHGLTLDTERTRVPGWPRSRSCSSTRSSCTTRSSGWGSPSPSLSAWGATRCCRAGAPSTWCASGSATRTSSCTTTRCPRSPSSAATACGSASSRTASETSTSSRGTTRSTSTCASAR